MSKKDFPVDDFEQFLAQRLETGFKARTTDACPVACWLNERTGARVSVSHSSATIGGKRRRLPDILGNFIDEIDDESQPKYISGRKALRILHWLMQEEKGS
jgi:hypothetical protein